MQACGASSVGCGQRAWAVGPADAARASHHRTAYAAAAAINMFMPPAAGPFLYATTSS